MGDEARFDEQMKNFLAATSSTVYKVAKDPNKPKQTKNPFMFFMAEYSVKVRSENPDSHMSVGDVSRMVSAKWASLTDAEKQKYTDMADKDKQRHEEEMKNYQAPPPVMVAVNDAKDPNKPKRNLSAFMFFSIETGAKMRKENSGMSTTDISKAIGSLWKDIDAEKRKKYDGMAEKDIKRYEEEMELYNAGKFVPKSKHDSETHDAETGDNIKIEPLEETM